MSPLRTRNRTLIQCVLYGDASDVKNLLSQGKDPRIPDNNGWTPIHHAAAKGLLDMLKLFFKRSKGKHLANMGTWLGETPLILACKSQKVDINILKFLLSVGADINAKTLVRKTPLFFACEKPGNLEVIKFLVTNGARTNIVEDIDQFTPLHSAIYDSKDVKMIEYLVPLSDLAFQTTGFRDVLSMAYGLCRECVPIILTRLQPTNKHLKLAIRWEDWETLSQLMLKCKTFFVDSCYKDDLLDLPCDFFLPVHFPIGDPKYFKMVLYSLPPISLNAYEDDNGLRPSLPVWIASRADVNVVNEELEILLQYNHQHRRHQKIFFFTEISDTVRNIVCKYFVMDREKDRLCSLKDSCRIAFRKAIRSHCGSDWLAYRWLMDSALPQSMKRYLLYCDYNSD